MNTIDEIFRENVRNYPDSIAMRYYQDETWEFISYSELNNAVNIIAHGLVDIGIVSDSKVAIMCENRPEWVVSYLACVTAGVVAVPIDAILGEVETEHILKHSRRRDYSGMYVCDNLSLVQTTGRDIFIQSDQKN